MPGRPRRVPGGLAVGSLLLTAAGCSVFTCEPLTITVAQKQEYGRVEMQARGFQTTAAGGLAPVRVPELTWQYWVQAAEGGWYRVSAEEYRSAEASQSLRVCR